MSKWYIRFSILGIALGIIRFLSSPHTAISFEEAWIFVLVTTTLWASVAAMMRPTRSDPKPIFAMAFVLWLFFSIASGMGYLVVRLVSA
jgi:hypothetical protein